MLSRCRSDTFKHILASTATITTPMLWVHGPGNWWWCCRGQYHSTTQEAFGSLSGLFPRNLTKTRSKLLASSECFTWLQSGCSRPTPPASISIVRQSRNPRQPLHVPIVSVHSMRSLLTDWPRYTYLYVPEPMPIATRATFR